MPHEPKKRHSRARQGKRRTNIKLQAPAFVICNNCKNIMLPHKVCRKCGYYNGKQVLAIKTKKEKPSTSEVKAV